jgi:hypothetical protein
MVHSSAAANLDVLWPFKLSSMEPLKKRTGREPSTMSIRGENHTCYSFSYIYLDLEAFLQYKHINNDSNWYIKE